jgi:hypothetical protein
VNPFKTTDPEKKLARDLTAARSTRDKLAEGLEAAEATVTERRAAAQRLARDNADDGALDVAEAALRGAQDRVSTLSAALAEPEQQVIALERARDDLVDKKLRIETASAIEKLAQEIIEAGTKFDIGATALAETSCKVAAIVLDGHGLQAFAMNARVEVPAAVTMIVGILKDRARATLAGTAPAALPKAEPEQVIVPSPKVEVKTIFFLRAAKYHANGHACPNSEIYRRRLAAHRRSTCARNRYCGASDRSAKEATTQPRSRAAARKLVHEPRCRGRAAARVDNPYRFRAR